LTTIYHLFDSKKLGFISSDHIDLESVPAEILLIFKPLLVEMEEFNETLAHDEFVNSAIALLKTLPIHCRNLILNFDKKK
jgi:hypothetical protein